MKNHSRWFRRWIWQSTW